MKLRHLTGTLQVTKYHGQRRETRIDTIRDADIVLTTHHTLAADRSSNKHPLGKIGWFRIVLDEGEQSALHKTIPAEPA
jgi:SWI/SNF-related matrix-associated actin-dependent regulator of chromatin subfamily A3